jgi:MFS family permease
VALADPGFRRLFAVRLASQFGDGVFQASLAGTVLFNPERQAHAADIAAGFAVLLLPYSLVGPFAGVLLDRWWRQRILTVANVARAAAVVAFALEIAVGTRGVPFYASALLLISVSRFILSALSAALPHVVADEDLVTANALSTTSGSLVAALGGAAAIGVRAAIGTSDAKYAVIAAVAAGPYLFAAAAATGFGREVLGPTASERRQRETLRDVATGLVEGARHVRARRPVFDGLAMITAHRFCYGVSTVGTLLLYRNYFHDEGFFRAGLGGLSQVVAVVAAGGALAAVVTPSAFRRIGPVRWPVALLAVAAAVQLGLGLPFRLPLVLLAALPLGFAAQGAKITVDTLVQQQVDDDYRGRVFSVYDTLINVSLVLAAVVTAVVAPESGHSVAGVWVISSGYALTALAYLRFGRRAAHALVAPQSPVLGVPGA